MKLTIVHFDIYKRTSILLKYTDHCTDKVIVVYSLDTILSNAKNHGLTKSTKTLKWIRLIKDEHNVSVALL